MTELPIIDVTGINGAHGARLAEIARDIGAAARRPGFFYIVNHGLTEADMAQAFDWSRRFFALPLEEKSPLAITKTSCNRGYVQ
ncbi:MAG: efe [Hyphomicrobiales bacterium]|nr:efe [Hyphomicrobiales bacterium]